jgi:hypothetical protein
MASAIDCAGWLEIEIAGAQRPSSDPRSLARDEDERGAAVHAVLETERPRESDRESKRTNRVDDLSKSLIARW